MPPVINVMANLFRVSMTETENLYQAMLNDLDTEIANYRATGLSDNAIMTAIESDLENEVGTFGRFKGGIERTMDGLITRTTQTERAAKNLPETKYLWILDPTVKEHCTDCLERSEYVPKTYLEWIEIGRPGSGTTECSDYCRCLLEEVHEPN